MTDFSLFNKFAVNNWGIENTPTKYHTTSDGICCKTICNNTQITFCFKPNIDIFFNFFIDNGDKKEIQHFEDRFNMLISICNIVDKKSKTIYHTMSNIVTGRHNVVYESYLSQFQLFQDFLSGKCSSLNIPRVITNIIYRDIYLFTFAHGIYTCKFANIKIEISSRKIDIILNKVSTIILDSTDNIKVALSNSFL